MLPVQEILDKTMENKKLSQAIQEENEFWSKVFSDELNSEKARKEYFSSYWWRDYYSQISDFVKENILKDNQMKILEPGCGSGKASIILGRNLDRTLLDISSDALIFAEHLSKKFEAGGIKFVKGDIFSMPFEENSFDFVWNIGVAEHYNTIEIINMVSEMCRVTKSGGKVAIGIPNSISGPILKAKLIKLSFLKFIPGYRLGTEKFYKERDLKKMAIQGFKKQNKNLTSFKIKYLGNPLPMESPRAIIDTIGRVFEKAFPQTKFLTLIVCEVG